MTHNYIIYIREENLQRTFTIFGCEAAFNAYKASEDWVAALGLDAEIDLVDAETGEILASTSEF